MPKYSSYFISFGLILCSMFVGNGYTPICAVVCLLPYVLSLTSISGYIMLCVVHYTMLWLFSGMALSIVLFQIVMLILGDLCLLSLPLVAKRIQHDSVLSNLGCTLFLCLYYWWLSNSVCFTQMSGLVPAWKIYDFSLNGYFTCLFAGSSFLFNSLYSSLPLTLILSVASYFQGVSRESFSLSR